MSKRAIEREQGTIERGEDVGNKRHKPEVVSENLELLLCVWVRKQGHNEDPRRFSGKK
jgi:hypothetical protein